MDAEEVKVNIMAKM